MPYIAKKKREEIENDLERLVTNIFCETDSKDLAGVCNYTITCFLNRVYKTSKHGVLSYRDYNEIIGVLESAKLEFYRRQVAPYENKKIEENGDVYE